MQSYDAMLRLAGDLNNTVPKFGITAPEIIVLQHIHGQDAVVDIQERTMDHRPHADERTRLEEVYGAPRVASLFGPPYAGAKLPVKLRGIGTETPDEDAPDDDKPEYTPTPPAPEPENPDSYSFAAA